MARAVRLAGMRRVTFASYRAPRDGPRLVHDADRAKPGGHRRERPVQMMTSARALDLYGILQVDPRAELTVIQAAYHALARRVHPDQSGKDASSSAMALLNRAYGVLRDPSQRSAYDVSRIAPPPAPQAETAAAVPVGASSPAADGRVPGNAMSFGRYQGWTLQQIARQDPEYLEWLRRHSSGIAYRRQIDEILATKRAAFLAAHPPQPTGRRRR
jgi:curved DNA-binding protein CbpA